MAITNTFVFRLPSITLTLCLVTGLLIFVLGNWQTQRLASVESNRLGQSLAAQSAEAIRPYILHSDLVSLQVHVDHLVKQTEVFSAAVYSPQQRQLVHSGSHSSGGTLQTYRKGVTIEGRTAAFATVEINTDSLLTRYRQPLRWTLWVWAAFTVVGTALAWFTGHKLSRRLSAVCQRLAGDDSNDNNDELTLLEARLEPLMTQNSESKSELETEQPSLQIATMALHCKNLKQLEAQLSKDKFQRLLNKLDDDLDQIAALYDGQRRPGRDQTLFIEFNGDTETGDHPMRALFCAHILLELAQCYARSQGVAMELSAAVKLSSENTGNAVLNDFEREKREIEVARLAQRGKCTETLLDSATSLHHTLDDILTTEEVSESADLHKVASFTAVHQTLLEKQLRYLVDHPA